VEQLRATLQDDQPCPVCGALEHPYSHADDALQAMLASLQDQVLACRANLRGNGTAGSAQGGAGRIRARTGADGY
jgi:exonuclease SbcC